MAEATQLHGHTNRRRRTPRRPVLLDRCNVNERARVGKWGHVPVAYHTIPPGRTATARADTLASRRVAAAAVAGRRLLRSASSVATGFLGVPWAHVSFVKPWRGRPWPGPGRHGRTTLGRERAYSQRRDVVTGRGFIPGRPAGILGLADTIRSSSRSRSRSRSRVVSVSLGEGGTKE